MTPNRSGATQRSMMVLTCIIASVLVVIAVAAPAASAATPEYWKSGKPISSESHITYTWSGGQLNWFRPEASETWECLSSTGQGETISSTEGTFKLTLKNVNGTRNRKYLFPAPPKDSRRVQSRLNP